MKKKAAHILPLSSVYAGARRTNLRLDVAAIERARETERTRNAEPERDLQLILNVSAGSPVFLVMRGEFTGVEGRLPERYKRFLCFRQMIPKGNWEFLRKRTFEFEFIAEMFQAMDSLAVRARLGNLWLFHNRLVDAVNDVLEQDRLLSGRIQGGDVLSHAVVLQLRVCETVNRCELLSTCVREVGERGVDGPGAVVSNPAEYGEALVVTSIVAPPQANTPEPSKKLFPINWKHSDSRYVYHRQDTSQTRASHADCAINFACHLGPLLIFAVSFVLLGWNNYVSHAG
ncbi:UNVERIFIED_CONTAM: hypothetical protein PYX00_011578 [Menopon gallinae]|uniref:Uncharacterized protein n=1 Tax=Menopon gallinae TaxID=328185 RepID=A0AAW2H818_9NEOP